MSVYNMLVCQRCEETAKQAFKLRLVHGGIVALLLANLSILSYVAYAINGEQVCVPSALDMLERPKEDCDCDKSFNLSPNAGRRV